jgi:hypothetical protein
MKRGHSRRTAATIFGSAAHAGAQILVQHEEGGHRPHLAAGVPHGEIAVVEALPYGLLDDLVIAVVLAFIRKGALPSPAPHHFGTGQYVDARSPRRNDAGLEVPG